MATSRNSSNAFLEGKYVRAIQLGSKTTAPQLKYPLDTVATVNASVNRSALAPREQYLTRDRVAIASLANEMDNDPDSVSWGWFSGGWWRDTYLFPYNARLMESVLTLTWFYTHNRSWHPYYRDPALATRILGSIRYYLSIQKPNGGWGTSSPTDEHPATTGFGLGHLALSYRYLEQVPLEVASWDDYWKPKLLEAMIKASNWVLDETNDNSWVHGGEYSNQLVGGIAGAARIHSLLPAATKLKFTAALDRLTPTIFGDAGYPYEAYGPDFPYSTSTMLPYLAYLYEFTQYQPIADIATRAMTFFSYNVLNEPGQLGFIVNDSIMTRTPTTTMMWARSDEGGSFDGSSALRTAAPIMNAFLTTAADKSAFRTTWASGSGPIDPLSRGSMSPFRIHRTNDIENLPTLSEKNAGVSSFPYNASNSFIEYRRNNTPSVPELNHHYLYVRRPTYYIGVAWGYQFSRIRSGACFFYHPNTGAFVAGQGGSETDWGLYQGSYRDSRTQVSSSTTIPTDNSNFTLELVTAGGPSTRNMTFNTANVTLAVSRNGAFVERLPIVIWPENTATGQSADVVEFILPDNTTQAVTNDASTATAAGFRIVRANKGTFTVTFSQPTSVTLYPVHTDTQTVFSDLHRIVRHLDISATNSVTYSVAISVI